MINYAEEYKAIERTLGYCFFTTRGYHQNSVPIGYDIIILK